MRKLISSMFVTLDGIVVGPNEDMAWVTANFSNELGRHIAALQAQMGGIVLGRISYGILGGYWPTAGDEPGAKEINSVPKYVISRTLDKAEWGAFDNASVVKGDLGKEMKKLKAMPGGDLLIYGSASIVQQCALLGLIDEFHLIIHPLVMGAGKPLWANISKPINLRLLQTETHHNGVVVQVYAPAAE